MANHPLERCPTCRARARGGATCHRCGTDLSLLLRIVARARGLQQQAVKAFEAGALESALEAARAARALHDTASSRRLCVLAGLLVRASRVPAP